LLPSAKCTCPLFQGRTGCGGRPSGWHDIVTCQHLVFLGIGVGRAEIPIETRLEKKNSGKLTAYCLHVCLQMIGAPMATDGNSLGGSRMVMHVLARNTFAHIQDHQSGLHNLRTLHTTTVIIQMLSW